VRWSLSDQVAAEDQQMQRLLDLGRQLASQPTLLAQRDLIVQAAQRLLECEADLWLAPELQLLQSEQSPDSIVSPSPAIEAMRRARERLQTVRSDAEGPDASSGIAVPLLSGSDLLGVLWAERVSSTPFSSIDEHMLAALTTQATISLDMVRKLAAERRRCHQLELLREVGAQVASILDLDGLLNEVASLLQDRLGYPYVHLFTLDEASQRIRYRAGSGARSQAFHEQGLSYQLDDPEGLIPWAARRGETVVVNDVSRDPRYRPSPLPPSDTLAEMVVPLVFGRQVLGLLDVQSDRRDAFGDHDRFLLEGLADNVAVAIRNANLYRSERWRRQAADSLRDVAALLATGVDLDSILDAILAALQRNLPCDAMALWLLRDGHLCLGAALGFAGEVCLPEKWPETDPWLRRALEAEEPIVRTATSPYEPLGETLGFPPDYSAIAAPLRAANRRLGVLTMVHRSPGRYGHESRSMTAAFASYAAVAIENARLYQTAQEQAYVSTILLQVAEATQSLTTLDEVLDTVVRLTPMVTGVSQCALLLWDGARDVFVPSVSYGMSAEQSQAFDRWIGGLRCQPAFDLLNSTKEPVYVPSLAEELGLPAGMGADAGFVSPWLVPLAAHGEVLGAMVVDYRPTELEQGTFSELRDLPMAILRGIAYQAAAAVANTQLLQERQEEAYVSVALLQVAQVVVSQQPLSDILEAIIRIMTLLAGVERSAMFLWDDILGAFRVVEFIGFPCEMEAAPDEPRPRAARSYTRGQFPLLDAVRERDDVVIYSYGTAAEGREASTDLVPAELAARLKLPDEQSLGKAGQSGALIAAPLSVVGDVLGVLLVEDAGRSAELFDRRVELVTGIARQAALAVQNDRLVRERAEREQLERDLQLAHELQQTLMPREVPALPGWELAAIWSPARELGGDFYDFFPLPDGRLGLVIADVADKGISAALFMSLTRTLVRAAALQTPSPADALARVNQLLVPDAHEGMFVTAAYAALSLETGELCIASAGHNWALWLRSGGHQAEWLRVDGTALGVVESIAVAERSIVVQPGDYVIMYTDGVTEAVSPQGDFYDNVRLLQAARSATGGPAQAMLEAILASVRSFAADGPLSDDLTVLVLRRVNE
jgi:sigma-B regulation protein RsbU (phosphoserine phosphatase)